MRSRSRNGVSAALAACTLGMSLPMLVPASGLAQDFPAKPVRMVVGFTPGTTVDILGRLLAQRLGERWGQQVVVENIPGASSTIAAAAVARAPADGTALFKAMAKVDITEIPYKSSTQALTDVMGGEMLNYPSLAAVLPHVRSGRVKALAVSAAKRSAALPDVPAMAEFLPGYEASGWYGVLVPASTPAPLASRLHKEIASVLEMPEVGEKMSAQGAEVMGNTPEAFARFMREGRDKWDVVLRKLNIPLL